MSNSLFVIEHRDAPGTGWEVHTKVKAADRLTVYEAFQQVIEHAPDPANWRMSKVKPLTDDAHAFIESHLEQFRVWHARPDSIVTAMQLHETVQVYQLWYHRNLLTDLFVYYNE